MIPFGWAICPQVAGYSYNVAAGTITQTHGNDLSTLTETVNYPDFSKTFSYTYDNNGQKRSFTMPDGSTVSYTYNDNNELEDIRIPGVGNISSPSYTLGLPDSMSSPGDTRSYAYDALARLEDLDSSTLDYSYSYDDVGNILTKTTEHGSYVYDYDDVYRLTDVDNPTQDDEAYTYDGVGNRETASGVSGAITHNANNELEVYGDITYDYDANGNLVSQTSASESWAYTYNVQNRLVRVEEDDLLIAEYGYDPFGRRLWKEVDGERTYFLYSDEGLVAEYDEEGNEIRSYGYKPDSTWGTDPLWLKENDEYSWYHNDHLGTPQKLIDSGGTVVWSATYTAFGEADVQVETIVNNLRFPGQYADAETGLYYNFHRYYDPKIGRYLRVDPIGFLGGINLYAYVAGNPVNWFDAIGWDKVILLWPEHDDGAFQAAALSKAKELEQQGHTVTVSSYSGRINPEADILYIYSHGNPSGPSRYGLPRRRLRVGGVSEADSEYADFLGVEKELHLMGCSIGEDFDSWLASHGYEPKNPEPGNQSFAQYLALYLQQKGKQTKVFASQTGADYRASSPTGKFTDAQIQDLLDGKKVNGYYWQDAVKKGHLKVEYYPVDNAGYTQFPVK